MDKLLERAQKYYLESYEFGVIDDELDELPRGTGVPYAGAWLYIDLRPSSELMSRKHRSVYLKISHICLSLLNDAAAELGAKSEWTRFTGNGMTACFVDQGFSNNVWNALLAAIYARTVVNDIIPELSPLFKSFDFSVSSAVHHDIFLAANIGPGNVASPMPLGAPLGVTAEMLAGAAGGDILVTGSTIDKIDFKTLFGWESAKYKKMLFNPVFAMKIGKMKVAVCRFNEKNFEKILDLAAE